jgi:hypothetical protein
MIVFPSSGKTLLALLAVILSKMIVEKSLGKAMIVPFDSFYVIPAL